MFKMLVECWDLRGIFVLIMLILFTIEDYKRKEITLYNIYIFAAAGLGIQIIKHDMSIISILSGMGVGMIMVLISKLTKGGIGMGDGMLLIVTGIYLGGSMNIKILLFSLLGVFCVTSILVICKKIALHEEIPFIPFIFLSYIGLYII